jgi:hypothetical protein
MPGFQADVMGAGMSGGAASAINGDRLASQTATGTVQADAFQLTASSTEFTTVASGTGARLPGTTSRVVGGDIVAVFNQGANALLVYPPVGSRIGTAATNASVSVAAGKAALFAARGDGSYFVFLSA